MTERKCEETIYRGYIFFSKSNKIKDGKKSKKKLQLIYQFSRSKHSLTV